MLKIHSSFSKKVPVRGVRMSSQSYHATVEMELPDGLTPAQLRQKIHETFGLVRDSVEQELASESPAPADGNGSNGNGGHPVSQKQLRFIRSLGAELGCSQSDLDRLAMERFGEEQVARLSRPQASRLIDELSSTRRNQQTRRAA